MLPAILQRGRITRAQYKRRLPRLRDALISAQFDLRKARTSALAVIVTGLPAAGRSETVNKLLEWLDPKFVTVHAFGKPDAEEQRRPALWRYWRVLPARGRIAFYFAGWYGEWMTHQVRGPAGARRHAKREIERIRQLETMLVADGVRVVKIFLHIDAKTQRKRLARLRADKLTRWRVTSEDRWLARHYKTVFAAVERCLKSSDHGAARWRLIDGTDEEYRLLKMGEILRDELRAGLRRAVPTVSHPSSAIRFSTPKPSKEAAHAPLADREYQRELERLQGRLALLARRASFQKHGLVVAFEGVDAAGKGGAIRRVTHALDARQYQVVPVSAPTSEELSYPWLWRFWRHVPKPGHIAIFDRSWYGRVLVERVRGLTPKADWRRAYGEIAEFERQLVEHGLIVMKFWLSVSKAEQLKRFEARDANPLKRFKVDPEDWINRKFFDAYQLAAAEMIRRTHVEDARWTIVPADDKKAARLQVLESVCDEVERALGSG